MEPASPPYSLGRHSLGTCSRREVRSSLWMYIWEWKYEIFTEVEYKSQDTDIKDDHMITLSETHAVFQRSNIRNVV
jgi:hypothetical protein